MSSAPPDRSPNSLCQFGRRQAGDFGRRVPAEVSGAGESSSPAAGGAVVVFLAPGRHRLQKVATATSMGFPRGLSRNAVKVYEPSWATSVTMRARTGGR